MKWTFLFIIVLSFMLKQSYSNESHYLNDIEFSIMSLFPGSENKRLETYSFRPENENEIISIIPKLIMLNRARVGFPLNDNSLELIPYHTTKTSSCDTVIHYHQFFKGIKILRSHILASYIKRRNYLSISGSLFLHPDLATFNLYPAHNAQTVLKYAIKFIVKAERKRNRSEDYMKYLSKIEVYEPIELSSKSTQFGRSIVFDEGPFMKPIEVDLRLYPFIKDRTHDRYRTIFARKADFRLVWKIRLCIKKKIYTVYVTADNNSEKRILEYHDVNRY